MTDSRSELEMVARRLAEYWQVILAAVVVAAVLGLGYAFMTTPRVQYQVTVPVRLVELGDNDLGASVDGLAAAIVSPEAKAAVVASLGADALVGIGKAKSAVDPVDGSLVRVVVTGRNAESTKVYAKALARAAVAVEQASFGPVAAAYQSVAERNAATAAQFEVQVAKLQAAADANPQDSSIQLALLAAQSQRDSARDNATLNNINAVLWTGVASYPPLVTVSRTSPFRTYLTAALQGAVIGLLVGLAVAWGADRRRRKTTTG